MTAVQMNCPLCAGIFQIESSMSGQMVACPLCHSHVTIPPLDGPMQSPSAASSRYGPPQPPGAPPPFSPRSTNTPPTPPSMYPPGMYPPGMEPRTPGGSETAKPNDAAMPAFKPAGTSSAGSRPPMSLYPPGFHAKQSPDKPTETPPTSSPPSPSSYSAPLPTDSEEAAPTVPLSKTSPGGRHSAIDSLLPPGASPTSAADALLPPGASTGSPADALLPPGASPAAYTPGGASYPGASRPRPSVADALLPPGAGVMSPSLPQPISPAPVQHGLRVETARTKKATEGGPVLIPTAEGGYVAVREPVKTVGKGAQERELHVLPPEEKVKRRKWKTIIVGAVCVLVLIIAAAILVNMTK